MADLPTAYSPFDGSTSSASVSSRAALSALKIPVATDGIVVFVNEAGFRSSYYFILNGSALVVNGTTVLSTVLGGNTRWVAEDAVGDIVDVTGTAPILVTSPTSDTRNVALTLSGDGSLAVAASALGVGVLASDAQHGARGGGNQHANVVASGAAGFMSGADKTKLDTLIAAQSGGAPVAGGPFTTLNFTGAGVTPSNLGGGILGVAIPGGTFTVATTRLLNDTQSVGGGAPANWSVGFTPTLSGRKAFIFVSATAFAGSAALATMHLSVNGVDVQVMSVYDDNPQRHLTFAFMAPVTFAAGVNTVALSMSGVGGTTDNGDYATVWVVEYGS